MKKNTIEEINKQCRDIYEEKLTMMNLRVLKNERRFEIVKNNGVVLRDLNTYLPKLIYYLWEQPNVVMSIIKNSDPKKELKDYIAPFFAHYFYENILSSYYIEDNLMHVLTLLLSDEINNLNEINKENFLDETPCGCLLEELKRKNDIQAFFKTILVNSVENLEVNYSRLNLMFEIATLSEDYEKQEHKNKNKDDAYIQKIYNRGETTEDNFASSKRREQIQKEQENFNKNYVPNLDRESLEKIIEENTNDKRMQDYCNTKLNNCIDNNDYYSNTKLMDSFFKCKSTQDLFLKYQNYFFVVTSFINSLLTSLSNNLHLLPYSVKCLCKIISMLIMKKYPSINESERNVFIAKFFFGKLLVPILNDPGKEALINNFIISENTINNLKIIGNIIKKFTFNEFFNSINTESNYTPFNWYFIEKMKDLFNIFDNLIKVKLPSFIEKFINDELPSEYEYNYFTENPDEVINHRSTCFNLNQIVALLETIKKSKNIIFTDVKTNRKKNGLLKTIEKLLSKNNENIINEILYPIKKQEEQQKTHKKERKEEKKEELQKECYFLITELIPNERYEILFNIEKDLTPHFHINELKVTPDETTVIQNNILKVKNFFCSLLYNYNKLVKTDFDEGTTGNTINILNELKKYMKSSNFVVDGSIPSEWYVESLLEYLKKIPKDLTENDCEKLFDEIENDVNKSIKELDFETLSVIIEKLKYTLKNKNYYKDTKKLLLDIKLNEIAKKIIEKAFIPVGIKFNLNEDKLDDIVDEQEEDKSDKNKKKSIDIGEFEIRASNFKEADRNNPEKIKDYEKSKKCQLCITIDDFTRKFPNLVKYQELQDADIFSIQKILDFPGMINNYFLITSKYIEKRCLNGNENELISPVNEKIYDYVMSKIYDKIYPTEAYEKDNKFFQKSISLSWTELKHFMKLKKEIVFGSFLSDVLTYFKLIDSEKSPRKKLLSLRAVNDSIGFLLKLNGTGQEAGVDDHLPILNYALVKAQQLRMFSNGQYMELYIGEKRYKLEGSQLTQLLSACEFISNIKYSNLNNVTKEEYINNCNEAYKIH